MQSQRYPNLVIDEDEEGAGSMKELHTPSLSGLAFACLAASLPLIQGQVNSTANEVLRLAGVAFPLLLEPAARKCKGSYTAVNYRRVQHLLNRMEQASCNSPSPDGHLLTELRIFTVAKLL